MTILTGAFIYVALMAGFVLFFRHVRSCDDSMRAAFLESLAARKGSPKSNNLPVLNRAS
jgi:hypothetical protein